MLNVHLFNREDAIRYVRPQTETEEHLLGLLKETDYEAIDAEALQERIEELETELQQETELRIDYENFYSDVVRAFQSAGVWPGHRPDDEDLIKAICDDIIAGQQTEKEV